MQKYQRRVKVQEEDGQVGCSSFTQIFKIGCLSIVHQNTVEIQHSINSNKEFQVVNQFANAKDNQLTKITQILCSDRSIRITDIFTSELCRQVQKKVGTVSAEQVAGEGRKVHKVLMKKKAAVGKLGEKEKGRDMRSVVKNIFRMFLHWVENSTPPNLRLSSTLKAHLKVIGKYNNHLIVSISKKEPLRKAFLTFCSTQAQQYIANSKIYDKQAHIQALNVYIRMCKEEEENNRDKIKIQEDDGDKIIKVSTGGYTGCGKETVENQNNNQNG